MAATLNGPLDSTSGAVALVFSGSGRPGDAVVITRNGAAVPGATGVVASDGTFAISVTTSLTSGDSMQAHAGNAAGPSNNAVVVQATLSSPGVPLSSTISAGATIITVSGAPGETVVIISDPDGAGPLPPEALGSAVIPSNGQVGVVLSQPLAPGQVFDIVINGLDSGPVTTSAGSVPPPVVSVGSVFSGSSVITGSGVPGATVQAVDDLGNVLGTTSVDPQGNFSLPVSGASAGHPVSIIQNGVKGQSALPAYTLNAEKAYVSTNVFNPDKGGNLDIGFRPEMDGQVTVRVYNIAGDLVRPVFDTTVTAGRQYQAQWNGKNGEGDSVASGVYFVSVKGAGIKTIRKVVVLK